MISFVGAGPGAPDLITVRGAARLAAADVVVWASSLVPEALLGHARPECEVHDSATMTLEDVLAVYAAVPEAAIVRLHSGDPTLYGAVQEQIAWCNANQRAWELVPGVSSLAGAAAAAGRELTLPGVSQSVILTRLAGRTSASMPARESVAAFAAHGATMAVFLSAARPAELQAELTTVESAYTADTPALIVIRATWPDERIIATRVGNLAAALRDAGATMTVLVLVGDALGDVDPPRRSHLYEPAYAHSYRRRSAAGTTRGAPGAPPSPGAVTGQARRTVEPPLSAEVAARTGGLRTGWTTGTCASAAAKAAVIGLANGIRPASIEVPLPGGRRVSFPVEGPPDHPSEAVVVKDAGDDPDCTDGARMTALAAWSAAGAPPVELRAGAGIGIVTKPGLGIAVGEPSITAVPRRMIATAIGEVPVGGRAITVTFSVPDGERMAARTSNARLGIVGGISILGTTGVVRPFSTAAYRASVVQQIDVAAAQGETVLVLATGSRSDAAAQRLRPDLAPVCFVEVGDFTGIALRRAAGLGFSQVLWVGMAGKIAKLAAGVLMTHFRRSKVDGNVLAAAAIAEGAPTPVVVAATETATARHFYEACVAHGTLAPLARLCRAAAAACEAHVDGRLAVEVVMVDFDGAGVVARSRP